MTKKRLIFNLCAIFFIAFVIFAFTAFFKWLNEPMYPVVPEKSVSDKIVLASDGCCFWATDAAVYLLDEDGKKYVLIVSETVYQYDIFECANIPDITVPVKVAIDFTSYYDTAEEVSLILGEFASTKELLEKGLLLCFGDGDLIVRNGENESFFAAGCFGNENGKSWFQKR